MQIWTMHNVVRYALVFADGPTVLFDLATGRHLSAVLESVSDVRPLDGPEGVKLEQPVLIADQGPQVLSALPLDASDFQVPQTGPAHPRARSRQDVRLSRLHPRAGPRSPPNSSCPTCSGHPCIRAVAAEPHWCRRHGEAHHAGARRAIPDSDRGHAAGDNPGAPAAPEHQSSGAHPPPERDRRPGEPVGARRETPPRRPPQASDIVGEERSLGSCVRVGWAAPSLLTRAHGPISPSSGRTIYIHCSHRMPICTEEWATRAMAPDSVNRYSNSALSTPARRGSVRLGGS